jgi:hypothetical protein
MKKAKIIKDKDSEEDEKNENTEPETDNDIFYDRLVPALLSILLLVVYFYVLMPLKIAEFVWWKLRATFARMHNSLKFLVFWNGINRFLLEAYLPMSKQVLEEYKLGYRWETLL